MRAAAPPRHLDGLGAGRAQRRRERRDLGHPLVEPQRVAVGERRQPAAQALGVRRGESVHGQLGVARRARGDGGGHVVVRQPGGLQLPGALPVGIVQVRMHGDVVPDREPELSAVEQPQVQLLRVVVGAGPDRVVDGHEHLGGPVQRRDREVRLEQPRRVGPRRRLVPAVDQGQPDDALPVARTHLDGEEHAGQVRVLAEQRRPTGGGTVEPQLLVVADVGAVPDAAHATIGGGSLLGVVAPPPHGDVQHVDVRRDDERHPHRRRPHPAEVLRGDDLRQVGLAVAGDSGLGVGHLVRRVAERARRGLRAEHPDQVAVARSPRAGVEPLVVPAPRAEQVLGDQRLQRVPDRVRGGRLERLRNVERVGVPVEHPLLPARVVEQACSGLGHQRATPPAIRRCMINSCLRCSGACRSILQNRPSAPDGGDALAGRAFFLSCRPRATSSA